jgi:nucleotide-binding universal stress UspA family protein
MTIVVPFDGTPLSEGALRRAVEFGGALGEAVTAVTVIPEGNETYARERGWIEDGSFDRDAVLARLRAKVETIDPDVEFDHVVVGRYAPAGTIAKRIRQRARDANAELVVIGSENAGRIVTSVSSVGGSVAADSVYDVLIVRHPRAQQGGSD